MSIREHILKAARDAYPDPGAFPESYEQACRGPNLGDCLARVIAIEVWEATEGHDDPRQARAAAVHALQIAADEMQHVSDAIFEMKLDTCLRST